METSLFGPLEDLALSFLRPAHPLDRAPYAEPGQLAALFGSLEPSNVVLLFNALVCELSVLVVSGDAAKITPALESLRALLYPLKWPYAYVPVLPVAIVELLQSPTPVLCGGHPELLEVIPDDICLVVADLDQNQVRERAGMGGGGGGVGALTGTPRAARV